MEKTGNILKKYMKFGMTQIELGKRMRVTPQYINNIINNIKGPSENFLEKFYEIFDVSEEDKNKIREYEDFRRIPEKYQKELLFFRGEGTQIEKSEIKIFGNFNENNIFEYKEKEEKLYFPKLSKSEDEFLGIRINCLDYIPHFFKNDILLFSKVNNKGSEKNINYYNFDRKICLMRYRAEVSIKEFRYIEETVLLKALNPQESFALLTVEKQIDLEIIGVLEGYLRMGPGMA